MPTNIIPFDYKFLPEMTEIFFESSVKKTFIDEEEKKLFFQKYLGFYIERYPSWIYVAFDNSVLGYIISSPQSNDGDLYLVQPHLKLFESFFENYPGHLHINCHVGSRSRGVGTLLIDAVVKKMKMEAVKGIHIITGPDSANRNFYKKNGFLFESESNFNGATLLFMGKKF